MNPSDSSWGSSRPTHHRRCRSSRATPSKAASELSSSTASSRRRTDPAALTPPHRAIVDTPVPARPQSLRPSSTKCHEWRDKAAYHDECPRNAAGVPRFVAVHPPPCAQHTYQHRRWPQCLTNSAAPPFTDRAPIVLPPSVPTETAPCWEQPRECVRRPACRIC